MILPKEKIIYENLNTSFTNFQELLTDLNSNQFNGVIQVLFWEYEGVLFLDNGNVINAVEESKGNRRIGQDAINGLFNKVKEKDGTISVYSLSPDLITLLAGTVKNEIVYKHLTSDFTNLRKLLQKLKDEAHTGFIEILTSDDKHIATVFIQGGEPLESIVTSKGKAVASGGIDDEIFEFIDKHGAVFNVYKAMLGVKDHRIATNADIEPLLEFWGQVFKSIERKIGTDAFYAPFKDILIAKSDTFPFLDPFVGEFSYKNGQITFNGDFNLEFNQALGEVMYEVLQKTQINNFESELNSLKNIHYEVIEKYSLENILNSLIR